MEKIFRLILFTILCMFSFKISLAQDIKYEKQILFNLPANNVKDFSINQDDIYIKTVDSLFIITKNGEIKEKKYSVNYNYTTFQGSKTYSLNKHGIMDESNKTIIDLSKKLEKEKRIAKYLTKAGNSFYTCLVDTPHISYSSNISKVVTGEEILFFTYIVGIPSGLFCDGEFLWYLYNKSKEGKNGMLRKYDLNTGKLISENEIPVVNPVGIYVKGNRIFTYSNFSGEFIQLKLGGK